MTRDLSEPAPIPQSGIDRALNILKSGRLFRYGEFAGGDSELRAWSATLPVTSGADSPSR